MTLAAEPSRSAAGGYNVWEKQPRAKFHGALDDFRIYRGLLTEDQIRTLINE